MSFDPQNPRGAPRPTPPSQPPRYVPPQPVRSGPPRSAIAAIVVIAIVVIAAGVWLAVNVLNHPHQAVPTVPLASGASIPATARASSLPTTGESTLPITPGPATPGPTIVAPSPGTPEAELLSHIPPALQATCTEQTAASSPPIYMASCSALTVGITLNYSQYASADLRNSAYQDEFAQAQIEPDTGSCEDHSTWPAESSYDVGGQPVGRRMCVDQQGRPTIIWTDDRLNVLANATSQIGDPAGLLQFWTTQAGPLP